MKHWLIEMEVFAENEEMGVAIQKVVKSDYEWSDTAPLATIHRSITNDAPMPLAIMFKLVQEISEADYNYFKDLEESIERPAIGIDD